MKTAKRRSYKRNPLSFGTSVNLAVLAAIGIGGFLLWKFVKNYLNKNQPRSGAEKQVDNVYGKSQDWKNTPVYNDPRNAGYIPGLPASYPPATASRDMPVPKGAYGNGPAPVFTPAPPDPTPVYGMDAVDDVIADNVTRIRR